MKKTTIFLLLIMLATAINAQNDKQKVERACLDYIEGFYEADTIKLLRSIQHRLYKIGFYQRKGDKDYSYSKMTIEEALFYARKDISENRRMGKPDSPKKVEVLDVMKVTAAAKVTALWGTDYLLLSKQGDKWMIEEVIWEGPLEPLAPNDTEIRQSSFITENGERFLRFEFVLNATVEEVWKSFIVESEIKKWMAPVVKVDLRIGGSIKTHYSEKAKIDDAGTIELGILQYLPHELLTYKVNLNDAFPKMCREQDQNLQEIVQLHALSPTRTKIVATMMGWGRGKEWDDTYSYFEKGNKWSYEQLIKRYKESPVK